MAGTPTGSPAAALRAEAGEAIFTTISGGTLQLGNGGTTGSILGNVVNNAAFTFNRSDTYTFAGDISGTGSIQQESPNTGTVVLTGTNSYTGSTLASGGTLQANNAAAFGTGNIVIVAGQVRTTFTGTLTNSQLGFIGTTGSVTAQTGTTATYTGILAQNPDTVARFGSATDAGAVVLANASYTGGMGASFSIDGGTLQVGNGGTTGVIGGPVTDNANLAFDRSDAVTFAGPISGTGTLTKAGAGTLDLTGTGTLTGPTTIAAGTLLVDGSLAASPVTVNSGTTLGGFGTVGGGNALSGSTVAPGLATPFSTLRVAGNVTFDAGSTFVVQINAAGQTDAIAATGTATINGGTVAVNGGNGTYSTSAVYPILTAAGGRTGTFSTLTTTTNLAFLTPTLTYTANAADLTLTRKTVTPVNPVMPKPAVVTFPSVATTFNTRNTATAIEALGTGTLYDAVLSQTVAGARAAFNAASGEIHASAVTAGVESTRLERDAIFDRLDEAERGAGGALAAVSPFGALAPTLPAAAQGYAPVHKGYDAPEVAAAPAPAYTAWGTGFGDFVGWRHAFGDVDPRAVEGFEAGGPAFTIAGAPIDRDAVVADVGLDYRLSSTVTLGISYDGQAGTRANDNAVKGRMEVRF